MVRPVRPPSPAFLVALAILLAFLHAILAVTATIGTTVTHDEIAHLTAGRAYNTLDDYRLQPENGNLPQRWAALPMTWLRPHYPSLDGDYWRRAEIWGFGHEFLYESGNDTDLMIFAGRAMIALFSAGTGLLIFFWSRHLFGARGAFLSLTLFVFCPNFLAHGALATSDITMVFFFLAALTAWWWQLRRPAWWRTLLSAALFALACVAKFSAVLLLPMMALLALFSCRAGSPNPAAPTPTSGTPAASPAAPRPLFHLARTAALHLAAAFAVIWLFYGCRYSAFNPALPPPLVDFNRPWDFFRNDPGVAAPAIALARRFHALPEAFLYGFLFVSEFARQRGAFLNGEYSIHGWLGFFPIAFLLKTPLPLLGLLVTALAGWALTLARAGAAWRSRLRAQCAATAPLLVLLIVYAGFSLASHLNIGHRHLLPIYPVLFILLGSLGPWLTFRRPATLALVVTLSLWHVAESIRIRPHYLAYFNQLAGGPANGYRHLVDSSLDWGQDLPALAHWLDAHNPGPQRTRVFLSYFGTGDAPYEGIVATRLPSLPVLPPPQPWYRLEPGLYCIGATMLQQVYSSVRGPWTLESETEFQRLHAIEDKFIAYQTDPRQRAELQREVPDAKWQAAWKRYDTLRFARLCHYLRARSPDAVVNYTFFIYRLSAAELADAAGGSLTDFTRALERAATSHP